MTNKQPQDEFMGVSWSVFMESLKEHLNHRNYSYSSSNRSNTISSIAIELTNIEIDAVLDSYPNLVDENYRGWMVKQLKRVGKQRFIELAERSIKYGQNPQKLFVSLLKG